MRRGLELTFLRTSGNVLRFKVVPAAAAETAPEAEAVEAEPAVASDTPPKRRGGRTMAAVAPAR